MKLNDKTAIVTGAASGIGLAISETLAESGARVVIADIARDKGEAAAAAIRTKGQKAEFVHFDITDEVAVKKAMATLKDALGAPSILVNNAGVALSAPFLKSDAAFWRKVLDIDLMGAVYCTQAVLPAMLEAKWGRIINNASTAGVTGHAYTTTYCAAKHAMIGLTRALAIETARTGVTVNAVCPGYADTEMTARTVANIISKTGRTREEAIASLVAHNPQGRLIQPREVGNAVAWLCGDNAASVTGQSIVIAGGEIMP